MHTGQVRPRRAEADAEAEAETGEAELESTELADGGVGSV